MIKDPASGLYVGGTGKFCQNLYYREYNYLAMIGYIQTMFQTTAYTEYLTVILDSSVYACPCFVLL